MAVLIAGPFVATAAEEGDGPTAPSPAEIEEGPAGPASADRTDQLAHLLKLTPEQKAKVKPIIDAETQQMKELRGQKLSRQDRSQKFKALRDATYEKIKPLLTLEQLAQWDQMRNFRPSLKPRATNAPPAAPAAPPANKSAPAPK